MTKPTLHLPTDIVTFGAHVDAGRLALTAIDVAEALGISRAQLFKLNSSGRLPRPVRLGTRTPRWPVDELRRWLAAGCPTREAWDQQNTDVAT